MESKFWPGQTAKQSSDLQDKTTKRSNSKNLCSLWSKIKEWLWKISKSGFSTVLSTTSYFSSYEDNIQTKLRHKMRLPPCNCSGYKSERHSFILWDSFVCLLSSELIVKIRAYFLQEFLYTRITSLIFWGYFFGKGVNLIYLE